MKEKRYKENDASKCMVVFRLSYVVDKCYKYGPLVTLSKCYKMQVAQKEKCLLIFMCYVSPWL